MIPNPTTTPIITLPDIPAISVNAKHAFLLTTDGELKTLPHAQAANLLHKQPALLCHAPYTQNRLGFDTDIAAFDVLELFAFTHPGEFATPTISGLCTALGISQPTCVEDAPMSLIEIANALLANLQNDPHNTKAPPLDIANIMGQNGRGWRWTPFIFQALGQTYEPSIPINSKTGLNVWKNLPEWAEEAPPPPASHHGVSDEETTQRLQQLLGHDAEQREPQINYAHAIAKAFETPSFDTSSQRKPGHSETKAQDSGLRRNDETIKEPASQPPSSNIQHPSSPHIILAEAGTGIGKTLGYLAPASLWAEKNKGTVWVSTYTKNLQRQIDQELDRLYTNPELKNAHVATRKGRENYLCLLNLEETAAAAALSKNPQTAIASGIMARWTAATKDGDLTGGQYPGWLTGLLGYANTTALADRRGECIYSACDHYHKCFVEHSVRKAERARIVIANHALVMITSALATNEEDMPSRYIFDEGHHLFDAADSAFAAHLTATETRDLRRWILGNEGSRRQTRARGLKRRAEDLTDGMAEAEKLLLKILHAAACLPMDSWTRRLKDATPSGEAEHFFHDLYNQIYTRANGRDKPYSLETEILPVDEPVLMAARKLKSALTKLQKPMKELAAIFRKKLNDDDGELHSDTRKRLDAVSSTLERRATLTLQAWILMLENLDKGPNQSLPPSRGKARMGVHPQLKTNTRELRKNLTPQEKTLWQKINQEQLNVKFRRQQPIEPYIVDFICLEKRLIIEVDGGQHTEQENYDTKRTEFLQNQGFRVIRFWNNEITENLNGVLETMTQTLKLPPPPQPSPAGGEGANPTFPSSNLQPPTATFIDWAEISRSDGRAHDVGLYRHYVDPMHPFAKSIEPHVHGMAVTSATLRDSEDWDGAQTRSGANHLGESQNAALKSPFDYASQTKIFIINDVNKNDLNQVSSAYRALFQASNGGALGLFTAISRLRAVHNRIAPQLEDANITLYGQHVDEIDTGTLVDMFREDEQSCLLGTDAIRDGVDVPGKSLRLMVFDRTPWPRPTILHKARREAFGGKTYDEMITRLKLKQAFGRLIRRSNDKGVFIMLDSGLPSRLHNAFPPECEIVKCGLKDAIVGLKAHLNE